MSRSSSPDNAHEPLPNSEENVVRKPFVQKLLSGRPMSYGARQFIADNAGLLLVLASQVFFSVAIVAVKKLNDLDPRVSTLQLVIVRMGIMYISSLAYILWMKIEDPFLGPKGVRLLLVIRGVSSFVALFGVYYSLRNLSLSDATVLTFLTPMCTTVAGALFLKENFRRSHALAGTVSLLGAVLIARPPFLFGASDDAITIDMITSGTTTQRMMAVGVALFGVLGGAATCVSVCAIGKRAHALHTLAYYSSFCVIISTIVMMIMRIPFVIPSRLDWLALLFVISIFGFIGHLLIAMGLQREAAGRASMGMYSQIVFATILERIFFHTTPPWLSIIGTCLILSSALYVAITKEKEKSTQSTVGLNPDDFDHVEAALHGTHAKTSHADLSQEET